MKNRTLFKKIIYSSAFMAAVPALILMWFINPPVSRFSMSSTPTMKFLYQTLFEDLNSDSVSEFVAQGKGSPYYFIEVRSFDFHFFDQWNLKDGVDPNISQFFTGNFDHDLYKEIYVFTNKQDSLFLNVNEIYDPNGIKVERAFITKIGFRNNTISSTLYPAGFFDRNGDGKDELYFSITSSFDLGPRKVYSYDLVNHQLDSSQFAGIVCIYTKMTDADGDNRPEIFGTMTASGNFRSTIPYSDSSAWFMVFDDRLKFKFPPVGFRGYSNSLEINAYKSGDFRGYILSHRRNGTDTTVLKSMIMMYTSDGKLVRSRPYSDFGFTERVRPFVFHYNHSDRIYMAENRIIELNSRLETVRSIPILSNTVKYTADVDGDKRNEFLVYSEDEGRMAVYSDDLIKLAEMKFRPPSSQWLLSGYYSPDHKYKLYMKAGEAGYLLTMYKNRLYYLGYLVFPGIYVLFFVFILLIQRVNTFQIVEKESLKNRLVTLQLQGIRSQLDPHFTFNTMNSVASLIYMDDRKAAYDYMTKFTEMLRRMLNDAERIYRSLNEELEFLKTYLDLEKMRFGDKFDYEIEIADGVSRFEQVPKLVLQTFAENAIKHGLQPAPRKGILNIKIVRDLDYLKLTIEDNGIGRCAAMGQSKSTGRGLKITGEFYDILNQINKKPIKRLVTDLYDQAGDPAGTRVEVWVPLVFG